MSQPASIPIPATAIVVGADGLIGRALAARLAASGCAVTRTSRRATSGRELGLVDLDLRSASAAALPEAEVAFVCAALTRLSDCRDHPDLADAINHRGPVALARRLVKRGTTVVYLSTSAVLDCLEPWMVPDRPRAGRSIYGRTKGLAEAGILDLGGRTAVVRLSKVLTPDWALVRRWQTMLHDGETIEAFDDHRIAPIALSHALDAILTAATAPGIWQVSGARDTSYFDLARRLAAKAGASDARIIAVPAASRGIPPEEVLAFTSLDCERLRARTGFAPPEPESLLPMIDPPATSRRPAASETPT